MATFKAVVVTKGETGTTAALSTFDESDLMDGDVTVRVSHSTLNYKDGLALTGKAPVVRRFPMIPGIDFAGVVETSGHADFKPGDAVILNGWGTGETHLGAFAEKTRVKGDWLVPLPAGLSAAEAMAIGTAGYTAMLCVMALERHGIKPERGPVAVSYTHLDVYKRQGLTISIDRTTPLRLASEEWMNSVEVRLDWTFTAPRRGLDFVWHDVCQIRGMPASELSMAFQAGSPAIDPGAGSCRGSCAMQYLLSCDAI